MARYGTFKYGDGTKYGEEVTENNLWAVLVDWDEDGAWDDNEAIRMVGFRSKRGRDYLIKSDGTGFERVMKGEATCILDNSDGRYDANNSSSPLYPNVGPGKRIQVLVKNGSAGAVDYIITGTIENILPVSGRNPRVSVKIVDGYKTLFKQTINIAVQAGQRVDALFGMILADADWPVSWGSAIDSASDVIPFWWARNEPAWESAQLLAEAMLGTFFLAADGKASFYGRSHSGANVLDLTQDYLKKEIGGSQPWEVIRNNITVVVNPRVSVPATELWRATEVISIPAGGSFEFWSPYKYGTEDVPATNVIPPVSGTDYTANTAADGSGTNITAYFTPVIYDFGTIAKQTYTNSYGSTGYLTLAKLRGDALSLPHDMKLNKEDPVSVARFGTMVFELNNPFLQDVILATTFKDYLALVLPEVREFPKIQMQSRPNLQFVPDLFDRIGLTVEKLGISNVFSVGSIEHEWISENGQDVLTVLRCEPLPPVSAAWSFPVQYGSTAIFGF